MKQPPQNRKISACNIPEAAYEKLVRFCASLPGAPRPGPYFRNWLVDLAEQGEDEMRKVLVKKTPKKVKV